MTTNDIKYNLYNRDNTPVAFSAATLEKIGMLIRRYPEGQQKSALLPVLHIAQEELGGYLTVDIMDYVASLLNLQPIEVYEVATFYTMFYLEKVGKYVIEVCRTGPCSIMGSDPIVEYLEETLRIRTGETTPDGLFTLKTVECLGACGYAPVMQVNNEFYERLTTERIDQILDDLRKNKDLDKSPGSRWVEKFY